jgi:hypothetical protein
MAANATPPEAMISYTIFEEINPVAKIDRTDVAWSELVARVRNAATYIDKAHCPLISLCEYGGNFSEKGCVRHSANVLRIYGVELDYDGELMPVSIAAQRFTAANITSVIYTSPSHKPDRPRWRALLPLSEPALPAQRAVYVGRANRLLGGIASRESFTLSQSFYIGRVKGAEYEVAETSGRFIDEAADLEPLYFVGRGQNGDSRVDHTTDAELRAAFERGEDRYQAMLKLSSRWAARGLTVGDIESALNGLFGDADARNQDGIDLRGRVAGMAESAVRKFGETRRPTTTEEAGEPADESENPAPASEKPQEKASRRRLICWPDLQGKLPPDREWVIPYWLPAGHVTLLAGRAGVGKTMFTQHIGAAVARGAQYLEPLIQRRVLMWAGEDDTNELWRRQIGISSYLEHSLADLENQFFLQSYSGVDITLASPIFGNLEPTAMLGELREQVADYKAELVILDNIARLFGGSENDRHAVTTFIAWVQGACAPAAVLLLGHPAKAIGSEFSGSTAWEGAVRARLYLSDRPPDAPAGDEETADPHVRYISRRKANYSELEIRRLKIEAGVWIPDMPAATLRPTRQSGDFVKDTVRRAITQLASRELYGNAAARSGEYLPRLAKQFSLLDTVSEKAFTAAMREMIMAAELKSEEVGKYANRTPKMGLKLVHK